MIKVYKFYKDTDRRWYIDLPEWEGEKGELEMVSGADILLDILSGGERSVLLQISEFPFPKAKVLTHLENGYYDNIDNFGPSMIWLCSVTKFVFGKYPDKIYFK